MSLHGRLAVLVLAASVVFAVGCGKTVIDDAKTEGALRQDIESSLGKTVEEVDCPSDVEVEANTTFECSVSLSNGREETATLRIVNEDADINVVDLSPAK